MPTGGWSHRMRFSSRHLGCVRDCRFMHNRRPDPVDDREQLIDAVPAAVAIADDLEAGTPQRIAEIGVVTALAEDRKSTRLNSGHSCAPGIPTSARKKTHHETK